MMSLPRTAREVRTGCSVSLRVSLRGQLISRYASVNHGLVVGEIELTQFSRRV